MGEHKHNPTAQLAKEGKLPPKKKPLSKRKREELLEKEIRRVTGIEALENVLGEIQYK